MTQQTAATPTPPLPPPLPRRWRWLAALGGVLLVLGGLVGLFASPLGLRVSCRAIEALTAGQLQLGEPTGTLGDSFALPSVHWRSATLDVQLDELQFAWQPAELLRGRLAVSRLAATRLRVSPLASEEPVVLPDSLELPLAVEVELLEVGRIELGEHAYPDGEAATVVEALAVHLSSDGLVHRLPELRARVAGLAVLGEAKLGAVKPFALSAKAGIEGEAVGRALAFDLAADGVLEEFALTGSARPLAAKTGDRFAGELAARLRPFASQAIVEAVASVSAIDPAAWIAGAPQAEFDLRLDLRPLAAAAAALGGRLLLVNRRPGPVDRQLLPIESLAADLSLAEDTLRLAEVDLRLSGGGRLHGGGTLHDAELALVLAASALDASALHGSLQRTRLAGPLRATLGVNRQSLEADLRDPRFTLQGKLAIDPAAVDIETLRLAAGDAQLLASGQLALVEPGSFALRGSLKDFDPSRFAKLPAVRLNADFEAQGSSQPQLALRLRFQLRNSRIGSEPLAGSGDIDLAGQRLRKADVELTAAGNRLSAKGAFGAAGERLTVSIAAPKLDPLGIAGDLTGQVILGGTLKAPELSADVHSTRLAVPGFGQLRGLDLQAQLGAGKQGAVSGSLRLAGVDGPDGTTAVQETRITADGVRSQHHLEAQVALPGPRVLRLLLAGGVSTPTSGLTWAGTLSEFSLSSLVDRQRPFVNLAAPMPLTASLGRFSAGPAEFVGAGWSARLERGHYEPGKWHSVGSLRALPVAAMLAEFPASFGALSAAVKGNGEPLRLNGDWDLASGAGRSAAAVPVGQVRLWRERGDLVIGAVPLGLEEGSLSVQAKNGQLTGQIRLRGQRLGEVDGEVSAASSPGSLINRLAPWRGRLRLTSPDLSWAGPLLGPDWQLGGRVDGELLLAGTPAQPRLNGEWRGDGLAVRALDSGMRLERGKLLLQVTSGADGDLRLMLRQLVFESDFQPMPRTLQLAVDSEVASLTGRPGRLEASGELRAGQGDGVLAVKAERIGVMQRPDQWMLVSGDAEIKLGERVLDIVGRLKLDAAYWELARTGAPQLSDDVVIRRSGAGQAKPAAPARLLSVNLTADLGRNFHFRGAGVETRLVGALNIRSDGMGTPRATGSIRTRGGRFDAYGQKLEIERGILNFQGLIDNPGLNIRAVRGNLPVEAGVEITGTARRPIVRLVSDPEVPDAEKLSWLVLGHAPDQQSGQETGVLLAAAQTLFGGQGGGPLKAIQRGLGIDDFGVSSGTLGGSGQRQTSRIASTTGFGTRDTTTDQIVSVGKRLSSTMLISYEQSLTNAGSLVKLTVNLSRNLSLIGRAGSETGLDLLWTYRFGR
jgi:translocation and assembly module TamB